LLLRLVAETRTGRDGNDAGALSDEI
jgi:hypothetical protein